MIKICISTVFSLCCSCAASEVSEVFVRDFGALPDDGQCDIEAINQAIEVAKRQSPAAVIFEAGTYNLFEPEGGPPVLISLQSVSGITLRGQVDPYGNPATRLERNVEEMRNDMNSAIKMRITGCSDLTVENIISDNRPAFTTAGKILSVDRVRDLVEIEVFPGLPHFDGMRCYSANIWDLETRELLPVSALTIGVDTAMFSNAWEKVPGKSERVYRLQGMGFSDRVEPGQGISWHFYVVGTGRQFFVANSANVTFKNIHVYNIKGIAFSAQSSRDLTFSGVVVRPEGEQLASGARDAFHFVCNDGSLLVENCYIKGVRWDPFNIKSKFCEVLKVVDRRTIRCQVFTGAGMLPIAGRRVVFWVGERPVTAKVSEESWDPGSYRINGLPYRSFTLVLAEDLPPDVSAGSMFTPQSWTFDQAEIRNSTIEGNYGRALLYQGENLIVENCIFRNNAYANIALGPINFKEGGFVRNALIQSNRFENSTWDQGNGLWAGTITLYQENRPAFSNQPYNEQIIIKDNRFIGINYAEDLAGVGVANSQDVILSGNVFENCPRDVSIRPESTINIIRK